MAVFVLIDFEVCFCAVVCRTAKDAECKIVVHSTFTYFIMRFQRILWKYIIVQKVSTINCYSSHDNILILVPLPSTAPNCLNLIAKYP